MASDLIFDIGMHDGTDTAFYLRKGFRVVAVEPNPDLVSAAQRRFADEIAAGRVTVLQRALTAEPGQEVTIYIGERRTDISTASADFMMRNARSGETFRSLQVAGIALDELIERHGTPHYIKIDVEGLDRICLPALLRTSKRPRYISVEADIRDIESCLATLGLLEQAGYRRFKVITQAMNRKVQLPDPPREGRYVEWRFDGHTSGPFGAETPGQWADARGAFKRCRQASRVSRTSDALERFGGPWLARHYGKYRYLVHRDPPGWYDIHAALS